MRPEWYRPGIEGAVLAALALLAFLAFVLDLPPASDLTFIACLPWMYSLGPRGGASALAAFAGVVLFLGGGGIPGSPLLSSLGFALLFLGGVRVLIPGRSPAQWAAPLVALLVWVLLGRDGFPTPLSVPILLWTSAFLSGLSWAFPHVASQRFRVPALLGLLYVLGLSHADAVPILAFALACVPVFAVPSRPGGIHAFLLTPWMWSAFVLWGAGVPAEPLWWASLLFLAAGRVREAGIPRRRGAEWGLAGTALAFLGTVLWASAWEMGRVGGTLIDPFLSPRFMAALVLAGGAYALGQFRGIPRSALEGPIRRTQETAVSAQSFVRRYAIWWIGALAAVAGVLGRFP